MDREFSYEREERNNDRSERGGPRGNRGMERRGGLGGRQWRDADDDQQHQNSRGGNRSDRRSQSRDERESQHSREPRERRFSNSSQWTDEETNQEKPVSSEKKSSDDGKISKMDEISSVVEPDCENLSSSNDFEDTGPQQVSDDNSDKISNNNFEVIVPDPPIIRIEKEIEEEEVENIVEQTTPLYDEAPTESVEIQSEEKTNSIEE